MAAGLNNYFNIDFYWRGANNLAMIVNPAKSQQFGTGITDLNQLKEFIKATFYLDDVIAFQANKDGVNYHGFWGTVIAGGANEKMHRENRWLEIYGDTVVGERKHTFNDAGLNTLAFTRIDKILASFANLLKTEALYRSSYFDDSTEVGVSYSRNGGAWVNLTSPRNVPMRTEIIRQDRQGTGFATDDHIRVRTFITNPEGTYYSDIIEYIAGGYVDSILVRQRPDTCSATETPVLIWFHREDLSRIGTVTQLPAATGIIAFQDDELKIPIPAGYYIGIDGEQKVFTASTSGEITRYQICQTPPPVKVVIMQLNYNIETNLIQVDITLSKSFSVNLTISGNIRAYFNNSPVGIPTNFSVVIPAGELYKTYVTGITKEPTYQYRIQNEKSVPASADGTVIDFDIRNLN